MSNRRPIWDHPDFPHPRLTRFSSILDGRLGQGNGAIVLLGSECLLIAAPFLAWFGYITHPAILLGILAWVAVTVHRGDFGPLFLYFWVVFATMLFSVSYEAATYVAAVLAGLTCAYLGGGFLASKTYRKVADGRQFLCEHRGDFFLVGAVEGGDVLAYDGAFERRTIPARECFLPGPAAAGALSDWVTAFSATAAKEGRGKVLERPLVQG